MRTTIAVGCLLAGLFTFALPVLADEPTTAPAKASIPDAAALKDAQKLVDEVYADDMAKAKRPQEKVELAKKLLQAAIDTKDDIAGKYVLLGMAKDTAASAGDADTAFTAIAELEQYQIDSMSLKLESLATISKSVRGQDAKGLVDRINPLIDEAISADRYDVAKQLAELAMASAKATKELDAIKAATGRVQEVRNAEVAYAQLKKALVTLADKPKDPEANLAVGRFYCLMKGQWEKGLPMLALGTDEVLKALAEKELAKPTDADKQVELGDGWWALAEKETGAAQERVRERAGYWYEQALPTLAGLVKGKVEKRLSEIETRKNGSSGQKELVLDLGNKVTMKLVLIPAGKFLMGSPDKEKGHQENEVPQHQVTISKPFYMGVYHVTRGQFAAFVRATGYNTDPEKDGFAVTWGGNNFRTTKGGSWKQPGFEQTDEHPVVCVSYNDAVAFCEWLSGKTGKKIKLPTEAQWEYACRAGTTTACIWGDDPNGGKGWCNVADQTFRKAMGKKSEDVFSWDDGYIFTSPVGKFKKNTFGLYDMTGNAWQWCQDWYGDKYDADSAKTDPQGPDKGSGRVVRGGSWFDGPPASSRCAVRSQHDPRYPYAHYGFRVIVVLGK